MTEIIQDQFQRIRMMIGADALNRLQNARVIIAGLGAVGSFAAETLARSGIGHFVLIDCDTIHPSNINRQLFALWSSVGLKKTEAAQNRLLDINPNVTIEKYDVLLNASCINDLLDTIRTSQLDFLIDAIDSLGSKVELLRRSVEKKIPLISSMGAALRRDPELVQVGRLTDVTFCPLSAMVRKRLRRFGISTDDIRCVYSPERVSSDSSILPPEFSEDDPLLNGRRRSVLGSLPTITGLFGLRIAHETIKFLLNSSD